MKIKEIKPDLFYSCQICSKTIKLQKEVMISPGISPLCGSRCIFRLYYKILSSYGKKDLLHLAKVLKVPNFNKLNRNNLLFEVTKKYPKPSLSTINKERTRDRTTNKGTGHGLVRTRDRTKGGYVIAPLSRDLSPPVHKSLNPGVLT